MVQTSCAGCHAFGPAGAGGAALACRQARLVVAWLGCNYFGPGCVVSAESTRRLPPGARVQCRPSSCCSSLCQRVWLSTCTPLGSASSAEGDTHEHEVAPVPNPRVLTELQRADAVIYGMGSLYTSIFPSLILRVSRTHCANLIEPAHACWAPVGLCAGRGCNGTDYSACLPETQPMPICCRRAWASASPPCQCPR